MSGGGRRGSGKEEARVGQSPGGSAGGGYRKIRGEVFQAEAGSHLLAIVNNAAVNTGV